MQVGIQKGSTVWMIGFGTGFKCNNALFVALRHIQVQHEAWA